MKKQFVVLLVLFFAFGLLRDVNASSIPTPMMYYNFKDQTSVNNGVIKDEMGNYNGQNYNGTWMSDGYNGGGIILDCTKSLYGIKTAPLPDLNNITVLFRAKLFSTGVRYIIYAPLGRFAITYGSTNNLWYKEAIEARRRVTSKGAAFVGIGSFNASNIASQLLGKALEKKSKSADPNTILLIEVTNTGNLDWDEIKIEFDKYILEHPELSSKWNKICAVFPENNIWLKIEKTRNR